MEDKTYFADILRGYRNRVGMTQLDLAMRLQADGFPIDSSTVSKYETGERRPTADYIPHFAKALTLMRWESDAIFEAYKKDFDVGANKKYIQGILDAGFEEL